jgi:hypothetical protein
MADHLAALERRLALDRAERKPSLQAIFGPSVGDRLTTGALAGACYTRLRSSRVAFSNNARFPPVPRGVRVVAHYDCRSRRIA